MARRESIDAEAAFGAVVTVVQVDIDHWVARVMRGK
jgi:hypothetical protein